ncbi:hypothetical protein ACWGJ2_32435 [Streptomyces sp. NPDC054796]
MSYPLISFGSPIAHPSVRGRIGLMPERVARLHPADQGVTIADTPFELGHLLESLWWHPAHERDPVHTWLRHMASEAGRIVEGGQGLGQGQGQNRGQGRR